MSLEEFPLGSRGIHFCVTEVFSGLDKVHPHYERQFIQSTYLNVSISSKHPQLNSRGMSDHVSEHHDLAKGTPKIAPRMGCIWPWPSLSFILDHSSTLNAWNLLTVPHNHKYLVYALGPPQTLLTVPRMMSYPLTAWKIPPHPSFSAYMTCP